MEAKNFWVSDTHFWHKNVLMFGPESRKVVLNESLHNRLLQYWEDKKLDKDLKIDKDVKVYWYSLILAMNERIIANWNSQVSENDNVYHLGDVSFGNSQETKNVLSRLNGNIHLIKGNHEQWLKDRSTHQYFKSISDYKEIFIENIRICMFHYPIYEWNQMHRNSYHLFGHCHGSVKVPGKALDVGIDNRPNGDMNLWTWEEIKEYMSKQETRFHH